ncbi:MAG: TatD family hydrolase [Zoogloeaceae bacterium]|jgi:TatD DNase family protein|nr:TatD family hydrolase [Zoogloeaceae bacterium]
MLIDSHCHLDFPDLSGQLPQVLEAMRQNGVRGAVCIGVNLEDFPRVLALAEQHACLFASVGLHPEYDKVEEPDAARLSELSRHPKVIAIGETGLDYHWHKDRPEWQRQRFRTHIRAAIAAQKPLVIHTREAAEDTLAILKAEGAARVGGIMHCFSENWDVAQQALALGFYISFSGIVTFRNAAAVKEVARRAPLNRILIETDSPYLAPMPYRGKPNQPAYVRFVAEEIARLREMDFAAVAEASSENFFSLFPETREALSS